MEHVKLSFTVAVKWAVKAMPDEKRFDPEHGNTAFRSPRWNLARKVKSYLPSADAQEAWVKVNDIVVNRMGGWRNFDVDDIDNIQADFIHSFNSIHSPYDNAWDEAVRLAKVYPIKFDSHRASLGYITFLSFVGHLYALLQDDVGLSVRKVGKVLDRNPKTIAEWIRWAVADGLIKHKTKHFHDTNKTWLNRPAHYMVTLQLELMAIDAMR